LPESPDSQEGRVPLYSRSRNSTRADLKLAELLKVAARIISTEGYERATMRKVAKAAGMSLAGLYYYVRRKEELLFLIQYHAFDSLVRSLQERTRTIVDPRERLEAMVHNHLEHFLTNMHELRVCAHEMETLRGRYYQQVKEKRQAYFRETLHIVEAILAEHPERKLDPRLATLYLFGMLNWIYMWYREERFQSREVLATQLVDLFLGGLTGGKGSSTPSVPTRRRPGTSA
jgi:AcrR family transcriptional regulator